MFFLFLAEDEARLAAIEQLVLVLLGWTALEATLIAAATVVIYRLIATAVAAARRREDEQLFAAREE